MFTLLPARTGNNTFDFADFDPEVSPTVKEHDSFECNKIFSNYMDSSESNSLSSFIS